MCGRSSRVSTCANSAGTRCANSRLWSTRRAAEVTPTSDCPFSPPSTRSHQWIERLLSSGTGRTSPWRTPPPNSVSRNLHAEPALHGHLPGYAPTSRRSPTRLRRTRHDHTPRSARTGHQRGSCRSTRSHRRGPKASLSTAAPTPGACHGRDGCSGLPDRVVGIPGALHPPIGRRRSNRGRPDSVRSDHAIRTDHPGTARRSNGCWPTGTSRLRLRARGFFESGVGRHGRTPLRPRQPQHCRIA